MTSGQMPGLMMSNDQMMNGSMMSNGHMMDGSMSHAAPSATVIGAREVQVSSRSFSLKTPRTTTQTRKKKKNRGADVDHRTHNMSQMEHTHGADHESRGHRTPAIAPQQNTARITPTMSRMAGTASTPGTTSRCSGGGSGGACC